ncbi:MAG: hypothetical protein LBS12_00895 [Prevotellaceae bacterium]|jgi:hypothetical protein|nr:hypothetical protein [Prevotellaceae bacterium]
MKKLLSVTILALSLSTVWGQGTVHVSNLSQTTDATPTLTFDISWTTPPSATPNHRDSVWLFADFRIVNPDGSTGSWTPATITTATITAGAGTLITSSLSGRGFFLDGHGLAPLNTTIRVTLDAPANTKFNACVYASDWPPNATLQSGGGYILKGTSPFTINNTITENSHTFGAGTCITTISDATGCPGFVVNPPFVPGSIAAGEAVCIGGTPTTISGIIPVSGGDNNLIYSWYKDGIEIPGATGADYTPPASVALTPGAYIYTRKVRDNTCNITPVASTGSWVLTVEEIPSLSLASGSNNQTVEHDSVITPIKYTATNTSGVILSAGGFSSGVSGSWANSTYTISGTPTGIGIYPYTITTTNAGCPNVSESGTITVTGSEYNCNLANITLGTVGFVSDVLDTVNGVILSAPVTASYCNKTSYNGGSNVDGPFNADCRKGDDDACGHYFSWCMVKHYADVLCPSPWRVPTHADFCKIATNSADSCVNTTEQHAGINGWLTCGHVSFTSISGEGTSGYYYSSDAYSATLAYFATVYNTFFNPPNGHSKRYATTLRCVRRDAPLWVTANETVCSGATPSAMTATPGGCTGTVSYQWQQSTDGNAFADIPTATADTYQPSAITQTTHYRVVATFAGTCGIQISRAVTKKVEALQTIILSTSETTICAGEVVLLTATGSSHSTSYSFNGDNWQPSSFTYVNVNATTTYTVKARTANSCESTAASVTVTALALPTFIPSEPLNRSACSGTAITLTITPEAGVTYTWSLYGGSSVTTGSSYVTTTAGDYIVMAENDNGCIAYSRRASVMIHPIPQVPPDPGLQTFCASANPKLSTLSNTLLWGAIRWYDVPSGGTSLLTNTLLVSGATYYAALISNYYDALISYYVCESTSRTPVTVSLTPSPTITRTGGGASQSIEQGIMSVNTIVYSATGATIALSSGSFPAGVTGSASGISYTISGTPTAATGAYPYTVSAAATANSCTAPASGTITVTAPSCTNCVHWRNSVCGIHWMTATHEPSSAVMYPGEMTYYDAQQACSDKGPGWHLPTLAQLECLCSHRNDADFPATYNHTYWTSTSGMDGGSIYYYGVNSSCYTNGSVPNYCCNYAKCVK